jgi:hypothetical protein
MDWPDCHSMAKTKPASPTLRCIRHKLVHFNNRTGTIAWEGLSHVTCQFVLASTALFLRHAKNSDPLEAMPSVAELVGVDFAILVHVS